MIRGLVTGLILGGATGIAALAVVSLTLLPPPAPQAAPPRPAEPAAAAPTESAVETQEEVEREREASPPVAPAAPQASPAPVATPLPAPAPLAPPAPVAEETPLVERPRPDGDPRPPVPEAGVVEVPAGSEFGRGRDDSQPVAPAAPEPAPDLAAAAPVTQPASDPTPDPPEVDPAAAPSVAPLPEAPDAPASIAPAPTPPAAEAPVTAPAAAPAPAAPDTPAAPVVAEGAAPPPPSPVPEAPAAMAIAPANPATAPEIGALAAAPVAPEAEPLPGPAPLRATDGAGATQAPRVLPQIDPAAQAEAAPDGGFADPGSPPEVAELAPAMPAAPDAPQPGFGLAEGVRVNRLPQLGTDAEAPAPAPDAAQGGALARHAAAFTPPEGLALMGLLLIPPTQGAAVPADALAAIDLPASVALDPLADGAGERMAALRAAGREVAILAAGLPEGALPRDLEVNFAAWAVALPEAALIVDTPQAAFQNDRMLATQMVTIAGAGGYGLVTHDIGLNSAGQLAAGAGLPRAESFAILGGEGAAAMRRTLDRAGFEAARRGRVLLVAEARPEVLETLAAWLDARPDIAAAPASAVLEGR